MTFEDYDTNDIYELQELVESGLADANQQYLYYEMLDYPNPWDELDELTELLYKQDLELALRLYETRTGRSAAKEDLPDSYIYATRYVYDLFTPELIPVGYSHFCEVINEYLDFVKMLKKQ